MNEKKAILSLMKTPALIALAILGVCAQAEAKHCGKSPIRIAVIDTGFGFRDKGHSAKLCKYGHKDFTLDRQFSTSYDTKTPVPTDTNSHGTNVAGIIDEYASKGHTGADEYCLVILKYYSDQQTGDQNLLAEIKAIKYATNIKADIVNISGGGEWFDYEEYLTVEKYLDTRGKLVVAALNEHKNLDLQGNKAFPAMYDKRIIIVGNKNIYGVKSNSSNYGSVVTRWEVGENVTAYGITMTGTSQATAVATGKIASESGNKCDIGVK